MQKYSRIAAVAGLLLYMPASALQAQNTPPAATPDTGAGAAPAPAPATPPALAAPATTTTPPTTTTTAPTTTTEHATVTKKKKMARMTRQQEIDKSIASGTVPSRYRKSVPKEYQQYIPFAK